MTLRRLTQDDLAAAVTLHGASFETGWTDNSLRHHIENDLCFGIFTPELSGFVVTRLADDQAEIITIAVDPARRGQGLGRQLMVQSFTALKSVGVTVLFLEVAEDNLAAKALYEACGFTPIGKRPAYYRRAAGRVAALTFRKDL